MKINQIFKHLKYFINPVWYFYLDSTKNNSIWISYDDMPEEVKKVINYFPNYNNEYFVLIDCTYQAWARGYINNDSDKNLDELDISIKKIKSDRYLFTRRMFKPIWSWYTLLMQILTFNNPLKEIYYFFKAFKIKQINLNTPYYDYKDYNQFQSLLINQGPLVSLIIPTLNRYEYLENLLLDLSKQEYENFEIIIIDQSNPFNEDFYDKHNLNIKVVYQEKPGLWKARNNAIKISNGDYILLCDDDSKINSDWIIQHLKCIDYFNSDISAGVSISTKGGPIPAHYSYFRWADQLDTGNVLLKREVFKKCGFFDLQFEGMRMGDDEFGVRAYRNGFRSINNPLAKRMHFKVDHGGLREMGSWDGMRPMKWFAARPIPSILYHFRKNWGNKSAIFFLAQNLPISLSSYKYKGTKLGYLISFLKFVFLFPLIFFQVSKSWILSTKKLSEGDRITKY